MNRIFKSLKVKLFLWYVASLFFLISYFLLFIHYYSLPNGILILIILFILLSIIQFIVIYKITKSITYLSSKMKLISTKNLEEKVAGFKSEDEIGELAKSFNNLMSRLNSAFLRERQFIADVAHELKTPLSVLKSSFEVAISRERNNYEYKEIIEEAIKETDKISLTLNNILDLAWSETPNLNKNMKKINLTEMMNDLYEITQKMVAKKRMEVKLSTIKDQIYIAGFKDKLARALLNLIDNAVKFSKQEGMIELLLEKTTNKVLISVIDYGDGILKEDIPYIFERFYRGSRTDKVLGSGLGLAIAKSIISLHGGEIKVKSEKGKGSVFVVILPL